MMNTCPPQPFMTPAQATLVTQSFDAIWSIRRRFCEAFYRRFFDLAPDTQTLFPADLERQYLRLMDMIVAIVGALDQRDLFQSIIRQAGRRHANFGVKPWHFDAFGEALILTLDDQLGRAFSPDTRQAWMMLYEMVREEMIRTAEVA
jgi:hemoglobin-like flavoprotein